MVGNVQSDRRGSMQPKSAERRCLFRAEVLQEIADNAARVTNDGLKTVDEAAAEDGAEDGAEEPTPDAMD